MSCVPGLDALEAKETKPRGRVVMVGAFNPLIGVLERARVVSMDGGHGCWGNVPTQEDLLLQWVMLEIRKMSVALVVVGRPVPLSLVNVPSFARTPP